MDCPQARDGSFSSAACSAPSDRYDFQRTEMDLPSRALRNTITMNDVRRRRSIAATSYQRIQVTPLSSTPPQASSVHRWRLDSNALTLLHSLTMLLLVLLSLLTLASTNFLSSSSSSLILFTHGQSTPSQNGSITHTNVTTASTRFILAWIGPTESDVGRPISEASSFTGTPALYGFQRALEMINNDTTLLPNITLVGFINSSNSDAGVTSLVTADLCRTEDIVGIIGEYTVPYVQQVQYVARYYQVPQCTPTAVSMDLTNFHSTQFPYLFRMVANIAHHVLHLIPILRELEYDKIASIYTTDAPSAAGGTALGDACAQANITILQTIVFDPALVTSATFTPDALSYQLNLLIASRARIFTYIGNPIDFQPFIRAAAGAGLVGDGYLWLLPVSLTHPLTLLNKNGTLDPVIADLMHGMIGIAYPSDQNPLPGTDPIYKQQYANYVQDWNSTVEYAQPGLANILPLYPEDLTYDCTLAFAKALHQTVFVDGLDPTDPLNRPQLLANLLNLTFHGVSGQAHFNPVTGDRIMGSRVLNYHRLQGWVYIGYVNETEGVNLAVNNGIVWPGVNGLKPVAWAPLPSRPLKSLSSGYTSGAIFICSLGLFFAFLFLPFIWLFWMHPVLKAASPTFLVLMVLGVMLLCASIIPRAMENGALAPTLSAPDSEGEYYGSTCIVDLFLTNIGYSLLVASLLVKTYRLHRIFRMYDVSNTFKIRDELLLGAVGVILLFEIGILIGMIKAAPLTLQVDEYDTTYDYLSCSQDGSEDSTLYLSVILSTRFSLILCTTLYAFRNRAIPSVFNESTSLLYSMYNVCFLSILLPVVDQTLGRGKDTPLLFYSFAIFFICVVTLLLMFVPKFIWIIQIASGEYNAHPSTHSGSALDESDTRTRTGSAMSHVGSVTVRRERELIAEAQAAGVLGVPVQTSHKDRDFPTSRRLGAHPAAIPEHGPGDEPLDLTPSGELEPVGSNGSQNLSPKLTPQPTANPTPTSSPPPKPVSKRSSGSGVKEEEKKGSETPVASTGTKPHYKSNGVHSPKLSPALAKSSPSPVGATLPAPAHTITPSTAPTPTTPPPQQPQGASFFALIMHLFGDRLPADTIRSLYMQRVMPKLPSSVVPLPPLASLAPTTRRASRSSLSSPTHYQISSPSTMRPVSPLGVTPPPNMQLESSADSTKNTVIASMQRFPPQPITIHTEPKVATHRRHTSIPSTPELFQQQQPTSPNSPNSPIMESDRDSTTAGSSTARNHTARDFDQPTPETPTRSPSMGTANARRILRYRLPTPEEMTPKTQTRTIEQS